MSNIYLIPESLPCPECGMHTRMTTIITGFQSSNLIPNMAYFQCRFCQKFSTYTAWFGKYIGMIKDVRDEK